MIEDGETDRHTKGEAGGVMNMSTIFLSSNGGVFFYDNNSQRRLGKHDPLLLSDTKGK